MQITSAAFVDGRIEDRFGGRSGRFIGPVSPLSLPFEIHGVPEGTVTFAVVFSDPDAVVPQGFVWYHWLIAGLKRNSLPEGASRNDASLIQGVTSWYPRRIPEKADACFYGGPNPPDRPHRYVLTAYALDCDPGLETGFTLGELESAMQGHVLAEASIDGVYPPRDA